MLFAFGPVAARRCRRLHAAQLTAVHSHTPHTALARVSRGHALLILDEEAEYARELKQWKRDEASRIQAAAALQDEKAAAAEVDPPVPAAPAAAVNQAEDMDPGD